MPPELGIILVSLGIAAYMLATFFYPSLRRLFRIKRHLAASLGLDEEDHRRYSDGACFVFAPLIAAAALIFAVATAVSWHDSVQTRKQDAVQAKQHLDQQLEVLQSVLRKARVDRVSFYNSRPELIPTDEERNQLESFILTLGNTMTRGDLAEPLHPPLHWNGWLTAEIPRASGTSKWPLIIALDLRHSRILARGVTDPTDTVVFNCPDPLREQFAHLQRCEDASP